MPKVYLPELLQIVIIKKAYIMFSEISLKKILRLCILMMLAAGCVSSVKVADAPLYSAEEISCPGCNKYQEDFIFLVKVLQDSHPDVYANFPKEEFEKEKGYVLRKLEKVSDRITFALILQQFCARVGDAHTGIFFNNADSDSSRFPFKLLLLKDVVYISALDEKFPDRFLGAKVISINDQSIEEIVKRVGSLASCENDFCRKIETVDYLTKPLILQFLRIAQSDEPLRVRILTRQNIEETIVMKAQTASSIQWRNLAAQSHLVTQKRRDWFWYKTLPEKHLCYMQFNSFQDRRTILQSLKYQGKEAGLDQELINQLPDFRNFLEKMFGDMQTDGVKTLVIDLRYNGGGNSMLGREIMYYLELVPESLNHFCGVARYSKVFQHQNPLWFAQIKQEYEELHGKNTFSIPCFDDGNKKLTAIADRKTTRKRFFQAIENPKSSNYISPFIKRFDGRVILLIGPNTFSSASDFATTMQDNRLATLIGQPIGQKPTSFGDRLYFNLPYSQLPGSVSYAMFYRPDSSKDEEPTLYPDVEIWPTIEDISEGKDPVFDYVLQMVN